MAVTPYVTNLMKRMGLSLSKSNNDLPYIEARMVDRNGDLSKGWLVEFYCFDASKGDIQRIQKRIPSKYKTAQARTTWANNVIPQINELLQEGFHRKAANINISDLPDKHTNLETAIEMALAIKKQQIRHTSGSNYQTACERFIEYLKENKLPTQFEMVDSMLVGNFLEDYQAKYDVSNVTRNNIGIYLSSIFSILTKKGYYLTNPFFEFQKLKSDEEGYELFTDRQVNLMMDWMRAHDPALAVFCLTIYYTFLRPKELRNLQVKFFNFRDNKIYIPGYISKNRRSESVSMPGVLIDDLQRHLRLAKPDMLAFGRDGIGYVHAYKHYWLRRHQKALDAVKIKGPTLYSWKHTGVCAAHSQGVIVTKTMEQCRHKSLDTHYKYLKKVGAITTNEMNKMRAI